MNAVEYIASPISPADIVPNAAVDLCSAIVLIIFLGAIAQMLKLIYLGIALVSLGLVFQLITLPVEFDASKRAKEEIDKLDNDIAKLKNLNFVFDNVYTIKIPKMVLFSLKNINYSLTLILKM